MWGEGGKPPLFVFYRLFDAHIAFLHYLPPLIKNSKISEFLSTLSNRFSVLCYRNSGIMEFCVAVNGKRPQNRIEHNKHGKSAGVKY